jgi:hypothetical protein
VLGRVLEELGGFFKHVVVARFLLWLSIEFRVSSFEVWLWFGLWFRLWFGLRFRFRLWFRLDRWRRWLDDGGLLQRLRRLRLECGGDGVLNGALSLCTLRHSTLRLSRRTFRRSRKAPAGWPKRLRLLLGDLLVARAVAALELEVLPYRVVQKPHRARSVASLRARLQVAAGVGSARSTRFLPARLAL